MKKTLVCIGLFSLFLAGCGEKKENTGTNPSGADFSTTLPILKEKQDTTNESMNVLANAPVVVVNANPPADETQKGHKIHAANNGVAEKDEAGNIKENFRYYDVPTNWTINTENTEDETVAAVYDVKVDSSNFMVQLYNINAFNKSPLEEGRNMTPEELEMRMDETNHSFIEKTIVTINGQEWQVGRQLMTDKKMGRITFYRMESTGAYDDSVVVGSVYYSLDPGLDKDRTNLKQTIGQLKDVLYNISKK
ncbi:glucose-6-phosphate isomerase [Streptococcus iners]|uniref:Glucose-6-phosphate isomerase n=1 Tax=Streptococcus iners subsp. hyiners TaxID=3028083 RepID=A0AA96VI96_9STRE|nr:glucose-6-phosphate isomerase [Streptococcus sp. 29892]MCK4029357.1 glucose-6-phosphate isomerase [Streptococcus suis]WNY49618.1 glucose-6-phosphate isomerase [Streptococcus sp. 29892]